MIGERVRHFRIRRKIGQGGMGEVYLAQDLSLDRQVALKFLPLHLEQDDTVRQRFLREARSAAALDHPYVCHIHEVGQHEGRHFIAMEYVAGDTLAERLSRGPVPPAEALRLAIEIAEALEEAHANGIVHRDLKPANIVITGGGHAKVMDFGLAKRIADAHSEPTAEAETELTRTGSTLGTIPYMSPEQVRADEVDVRTDIFSFGIIFYEMVTGTHPFRRSKAMDTATAILRDEPPPLADHRVDDRHNLQEVVTRCLQKEPDSRYRSGAELLAALRPVSSEAVQGPAGKDRRRVLVGAGLAALVLAGLGGWFVERQSNISWARDEVLPQVEQLIDTGWRDFTDAYALAVAAETYIPEDPRLAAALSQISLRISIRSDPPGARVSYREYDSPTSDWTVLGQTPLDDVRLPIGFFRWKFEKQGYAPVLAAAATWDLTPVGDTLFVPADLTRTLDRSDALPEGMVRVQGGPTPGGEAADFFIDRFEVTNRQYKAFVDDGGYANPAWWTHPFSDRGVALSLSEALERFVDRTGRAGPATWVAGAYPADRSDFPVTGISWYEAAAYAAYAGKSLPTVPHWGLARGEATSMIRYPQLGGYALFAPFSNFSGTGPIPVGSLPGITPFGVYDMAGNVREWCFNKTGGGRAVRGGAWDSPTYMFPHVSQIPAMDRSPQNGFRCALYPESDAAALGSLTELEWEQVLQPGDPAGWRDYRDVKPVSDEVFQVYLEQFEYDPLELNATVEARSESSDWVHERVSFEAGYDGERMIAHLFLPRLRSQPPYQTVVYFPGSSTLFQTSSSELASYYEVPAFSEFIVNDGRALVFPIYKGTFERGGEHPVEMHIGHPSRAFVDWTVEIGRDFKRTVDYIESRTDLDAERIGYYGLSWGSSMGALIPAIESRVRASVLVSGGLPPIAPRPEVDPVLYLPRVTIPTLMLNGRHDMLLPVDQSIRPMFELLGTPAADKELKFYDTDHIPPKTEFIRETLAWFDRYLGPIERAQGRK